MREGKLVEASVMFFKTVSSIAAVALADVVAIGGAFSSFAILAAAYVKQ